MSQGFTLLGSGYSETLTSPNLSFSLSLFIISFYHLPFTQGFTHLSCDYSETLTFVSFTHLFHANRADISPHPSFTQSLYRFLLFHSHIISLNHCFLFANKGAGSPLNGFILLMVFAPIPTAFNTALSP